MKSWKAKKNALWGNSNTASDTPWAHVILCRGVVRIMSCIWNNLATQTWWLYGVQPLPPATLKFAASGCSLNVLRRLLPPEIYSSVIYRFWLNQCSNKRSRAISEFPSRDKRPHLVKKRKAISEEKNTPQGAEPSLENKGAKHEWPHLSRWWIVALQCKAWSSAFVNTLVSLMQLFSTSFSVKDALHDP